MARISKRFGIFTFFLLFLLFSFNALLLNAQDLIWVESAGGQGDQSANYTTIGPDNEAIVTGFFWGTITFGKGQENETTLTADDAYFCFFIAKYDSNGTFLWVRQGNITRVPLYPWNYQIPVTAVDHDGNIYLTAAFLSSVELSVGQNDAMTLMANHNSSDIFIAKYSSSGNLIWAQNEGGPKEEYNAYVTVDDSVHVFVGGSFADSALFGTQSAVPDTLISNGYSDIYVAKYDSDGTYCWAVSGGGVEYDQISALTADAQGNVIIAGEVSSSAVFGKGQANETFLPGFGEQDILIAKYTSSGRLLWVKGIGNEINDRAQDVTTDCENNIIVTGYFGRKAIFGDDTLSCPEQWASRMFVAKYTPDGAPLWARQSNGGGEGYTEAFGENVDDFKNGDILVQAFVMFKAEFGKDTESDTLIAAIPDTGGMINCKYTKDGEFIFAENAGNWQYAEKSISIDQDDNVIQTGYFSQSVIFGSGENTVELTSQGGKDAFVAKYGNLQTGINHMTILPKKIELLQNCPNPFNPTTSINYMLPTNGYVTLTVFDVRGRKIKTLVNTFQTAGYHNVFWNGKDTQGKSVASGLYLYRLYAAGKVLTRKMILMK